MAQSDERSLQQIRQETEQTRASLTETVQQLRHSVTDTATDMRERISPAAMKAEVSNYMRSRGEDLLQRMRTSARDNPMQAAAVGVGLAYPLFRMARAVPLPLWMIGAGLYLAGSKTGDGDRHDGPGLGAPLAKAADAVTDKAADLRDQAVGMATDMTGQAMASATEFADSTMTKGQQLSQDLLANGQELTETIRQSTGEALETARATASEMSERAGRTVRETVAQDPLIVAGLGLLIGGVIASVLPPSRVEDDLIGETSASVKRRAQAAASQGMDAASEAARRAAEKARQEGLSEADLREGAHELGDRIRHVAEAAVTTAFEGSDRDGSEHNDTSSAQGETHHG